MEQAISLFMLVHGPYHIIVANKLNSLGEAYKYRQIEYLLRVIRNYEKALEVFSKSL